MFLYILNQSTVRRWPWTTSKPSSINGLIKPMAEYQDVDDENFDKRNNQIRTFMLMVICSYFCNKNEVLSVL